MIFPLFKQLKNLHGDIFLIHDEKDHEVPFEEAKPLHDSLPDAKKLITPGFGHRKILMDEDLIKETLTFLKVE